MLHIVLDLLGTAIEEDAPTQLGTFEFIKTEGLCNGLDAAQWHRSLAVDEGPHPTLG